VAKSLLESTTKIQFLELASRLQSFNTQDRRSPNEALTPEKGTSLLCNFHFVSAFSLKRKKERVFLVSIL
jgi:hypothetical protein